MMTMMIKIMNVDSYGDDDDNDDDNNDDFIFLVQNCAVPEAQSKSASPKQRGERLIKS